MSFKDGKAPVTALLNLFLPNIWEPTETIFGEERGGNSSTDSSVYSEASNFLYIMFSL